MKPNLLKTIAGGAVGTALMTAMIYFLAPRMLGHPMDIAALLGGMLGNNWALGMSAHLIAGIMIFPLAYALIAYRFLPGPPVARGVLWGLVLWVIAESIVMPVLGAGFFHAGAGGIKAAMAGLIAHLLYGGSLGAIAGGPEAQLAERRARHV